MAIVSQGFGDIESIADLNVSGSPSNGDVLIYNSSSGNWEPGAPSGGGSAPSFFRVTDDGSTTQLTTGTASVLSSVWDTPTLTGPDFSFSSGVLTVNAAGTIVIHVIVHSYQTANNRHELHVILDKNNSEVMEASTYTSRNNTQDEGSVVIPGFMDTVSATDTFRLRVFDIGVQADIGGSSIPNQTYISAILYK